jgi:regulator of protease activity HflC (stomatin/prohibitin superfamily)
VVFFRYELQAVVVQRMGKFQRVAGAGTNFKLPWLDQIAARIDLCLEGNIDAVTTKESIS